MVPIRVLAPGSAHASAHTTINTSRIYLAHVSGRGGKKINPTGDRGSHNLFSHPKRFCFLTLNFQNPTIIPSRRKVSEEEEEKREKKRR